MPLGLADVPAELVRSVLEVDIEPTFLPVALYFCNIDRDFSYDTV